MCLILASSQPHAGWRKKACLRLQSSFSLFFQAPLTVCSWVTDLLFSTGEQASLFANPSGKGGGGYKCWWTRCALSVFICLICFIRSLWTSNLSSNTRFTHFHIQSSLLFQVPVCQDCTHKIFVALDTGHIHFHLFKISKELDILFYSSINQCFQC